MARSVEASLQRAMLLSLAVWSLVSAGVVALGDPRIPTAVMVPVHLALALLAWGGSRGSVPFVACLLPGYAVWATDYLAAGSVDDAIALAACWLGNVLYLAAALAATSRARTWLPVVGSAAVVVLSAALSPVWDLAVTSAFFVTALAIVAAARAAMPSLWGLAEDADRELSRLETERTAEEVARRTGAAAAEDARLVHDTVINTLGAVANGAAARHDPARMRARCRRDLGVVEGLIDGRRGPDRRGLADIGADAGGLRVVRAGLTGRVLDDVEEILGPVALAAVVGAADEAVRNAAKHAGVAEVVVEVHRSGQEVVVVVTDRGRGFEPALVGGRGLAESMAARMRAVGGGVTVASRAGEGTRVRIGCPLLATTAVDAPVDAPVDEERAAATAAELARPLVARACWLLSGGIVAVGVVIEAANRPGRLTWTYAMLALVAALIAVSFAARREGRAPWWTVPPLVLGAPVGLVLALAGVGFGTEQTITLQAIGFAPPLLILTVLGRHRAALAAGALTAATAVATAALLAASDTTRAAVALVAALPALGLAAGWAYFAVLVRGVVTASERARALAAVVATEVAGRRELEQARRRWGTASLVASTDLLRGIAEGRLAVDSPAVRAACAAEERHLRELLLLSPAAYRITARFAQALAIARARGVLLTVRAGEQDVASAGEAELLGAIVTTTVDAAAPGAEVGVGWFPTAAGQRMVVVAPAAAAGDVGPLPATLPASWSSVSSVRGGRSVVEILVG